MEKNIYVFFYCCALNDNLCSVDTENLYENFNIHRNRHIPHKIYNLSAFKIDDLLIILKHHKSRAITSTAVSEKWEYLPLLKFDEAADQTISLEIRADVAMYSERQ